MSNPSDDLVAYVAMIKRIRDQLQQSLENLGETEHLARLSLVGQIQIVDAIITISKTYLAEK